MHKNGAFSVKGTFSAGPQTWAGGEESFQTQLWAKRWVCEISRWNFSLFKPAPPFALCMPLNGCTIHWITWFYLASNGKIRFKMASTGEFGTSWSVDPAAQGCFWGSNFGLLCTWSALVYGSITGVTRCLPVKPGLRASFQWERALSLSLPTDSSDIHPLRQV